MLGEPESEEFQRAKYVILGSIFVGDIAVRGFSSRALEIAYSDERI